PVILARRRWLDYRFVDIGVRDDGARDDFSGLLVQAAPPRPTEATADRCEYIPVRFGGGILFF
ncbi:MAG: hypothetical protein RIC89_17540, partial [Pseudomonadales bacterium]